MGSFFKREPVLSRLIVLEAFMAAVFLTYDVWEVASGNADLNQHLPFLFPAAFVGFLLITWRIRRHLLTVPSGTRQAIRQDAERRSYLHPDNLPKSRSRPGSLD